MHPAALEDDALLAQCELSKTRRSGPGGQHRNKVETAVVIHHLPSGIHAEACERRSASENRRVALGRLRMALALGVRSPHREPSALWRSRVDDGRLVVNKRHADVPALVAEALDVLAEEHGEAPTAAARLGIRTSPLVRLLAIEPKALPLVNRWREARGRPQLKA